MLILPQTDLSYGFILIQNTELTNSIQLSFSGHVLRLDAYILVAQPSPKCKTLYQREDKKGSRTLLVKSPSGLNE